MALTITALAASVLNVLRKAADHYADFAHQYVDMITEGC